jgi:hypothetical protein
MCEHGKNHRVLPSTASLWQDQVRNESGEPADVIGARHVSVGKSLVQCRGETVNTLGGTRPARSMHEQDSAMASLPHQNREITDIFCDYTAIISGGGVQHCTVITAHEFRRRPHGHDIVFVLAHNRSARVGGYIPRRTQ